MLRDLQRVANDGRRTLVLSVLLLSVAAFDRDFIITVLTLVLFASVTIYGYVWYNESLGPFINKENDDATREATGADLGHQHTGDGGSEQSG